MNTTDDISPLVTFTTNYNEAPTMSSGTSCCSAQVSCEWQGRHLELHSQAAAVQNLTSNRLLAPIVAEKSYDRHGGNSYGAECRTVGRGLTRYGYHLEHCDCQFLIFLCKSVYFSR